jgi:lipid A 3-O-deacylase
MGSGGGPPVGLRLAGVALALALGRGGAAQADPQPGSGAGDCPAAASCVSAAAPALEAAQGPLFDPSRFEIRGGVLTETWGREAGATGINLELVSPRFIHTARIPQWLIPRLQLGGLGDVTGRTSYGYAGALWTANWTRRLFIEAQLGATVHNGMLERTPGRAGLGCRVLWHTGGNLGYRFTRRWSVMITYDHSSTNEWITGCKPNDGLNPIGLRLGYSF